MIKLGTKVKESMTGAEGIATARVEYVTGVPRVQIEYLNEKGDPTYAWFDEARLLPAQQESSS